MLVVRLLQELFLSQSNWDVSNISGTDRHLQPHRKLEGALYQHTLPFVTNLQQNEGKILLRSTTASKYCWLMSLVELEG